MRGIESEGMVLCASDNEGGVVELMEPPAGAKVRVPVHVNACKVRSMLVVKIMESPAGANVWANFVFKCNLSTMDFAELLL
jgi:tRNA-binding EMAP/Myf-like protein